MNREGEFKKVNVKYGKPKTCKFCHEEVWWHITESRWYDVGGEVLHVKGCDLSREYYHYQCLDREEAKRQGKSNC